MALFEETALDFEVNTLQFQVKNLPFEVKALSEVKIKLLED